MAVEEGRTEVRIAGFGGQGVVLAGVSLGKAAMLDGYQAVQTQSYGAEARGGAARSEIVIAGEPIIYPEVTAPNLMVALSQVALERYFPDLLDEATLIIDTELVTKVPERAGPVLGQSFTEVAGTDLGRPIVANMVMLGYLVGATGIVTAASLRQAVREGVPRGTEELNLKAMVRGAELVAL